MHVSKGVRTRVLLIAAMAVVIASASLASLLLIRHQLLEEVTDRLSRDLQRSVGTFQDLQAQRLNALDRENALLADLPSLKALMTTHDARTIQNGAVEFRNVSGNDLFALADAEGKVVTAYTRASVRSDPQLASQLEPVLASSNMLYLISGDRFFACSVRPLYFGSEASGALLGYVISGFAIDRSLVEQISRATVVQAAFISGGRALASTIAPPAQDWLVKSVPTPRGSATNSLTLNGERYLAITVDLTSRSSAPLQLIVLKSFAEADNSIRQIDHLVLIAGLLAMVLGTLLMLALSHAVTRPLEELAAGVRAFGSGDSAHLLPHRGTREVQDLSASFSKMRQEIQQTNRALAGSRTPGHHRPHGQFRLSRPPSLSGRRLRQCGVSRLGTSFGIGASRRPRRYSQRRLRHHRTPRIHADFRQNRLRCAPVTRDDGHSAGARDRHRAQTS